MALQPGENAVRRTELPKLVGAGMQRPEKVDSVIAQKIADRKLPDANRGKEATNVLKAHWKMVQTRGDTRRLETRKTRNNMGL